VSVRELRAATIASFENSSRGERLVAVLEPVQDLDRLVDRRANFQYGLEATFERRIAFHVLRYSSRVGCPDHLAILRARAPA